MVGLRLVGLAIGLTVNSLLGPLLVEWIRYRYSESLINQGIGLDAVALFGAVPIAIAAGVLLLRRNGVGAVLAFIPATFATYMVPQYIIGPDYLGLPGNNERFFLFHLAIFVLAVGVLLLAWTVVDRAELRPASREADRRRSWIMFGVAVFILFGRWLPALVDLTGGDPSGADFLENPTAFLLIGLLDLGLVVPAAVGTGIGLRKGAAWAREAMYGVIGWFALVPAAVGSMAVVMQVRVDPNSSMGTTLLFGVAALVFSAGAALLYRPLFVKLQPAPPVADLDLPVRI